MSYLEKCITDERSLKAIAKITGKGSTGDPVFVSDEFFQQLKSKLSAQDQHTNLIPEAHQLWVDGIHVMTERHILWWGIHGRHFPDFIFVYPCPKMREGQH